MHRQTGNKRLGSSPVERPLGALVEVENEPAVPLQPGGTTLSGDIRPARQERGLSSALRWPRLECWGQFFGVTV